MVTRYLLRIGCTLSLLFSVSGIASLEDKMTFHKGFQKKATLQTRTLYERASEDRVGFWEQCAAEINWFSTWDTVFKWDCPYAQWFVGGKLNLCYNCIDRHLDTTPYKTAFIYCNERGDYKEYSYKDLHAHVCKLANGLKSLGVNKGDVVAIYMPNSIEGVASMLACARIGAIHSVIFGGTGAGSLKEKVNDSQAKVIITADVTYRRGRDIPLKSVVDSVIEQCDCVQNVLVLQRAEHEVFNRTGKYIDYQALLNKQDPQCPAEIMDSEDKLFVLYTSGTTGKPKGIVHTTGGYLVGVHNTFKWVFDYKPDDIFWCTADIGWITGHSYLVYGPLSNGCTQVLYEGTFDYPNQGVAWKLVEKTKATIFYTAPTLIRTFIKWGTKWLEDSNLSSLRLLGSIGEPLNPETWSWYHAHIGEQRCPIVDTWFQTETGAFVIAPIPGVTPMKPGSITQALPGYEVGVYNEQGQAVEHGFLAIDSPFPSMMRGVLNDPVRYYNTYWAKWGGKMYYAGDDAYMDEDDYIWCGGRADEVIQVCGHRIGTAELENVIVDFEPASEAAVVAKSHAIKGESIVAFVVLKDGVQQTQQMKANVKAHIANHIGKYASPEKVVFLSELPKTRSGKILRRLLLKLLTGQEVGDTTTLVNPGIMGELRVKCSS